MQHEVHEISVGGDVHGPLEGSQVLGQRLVAEPPLPTTRDDTNFEVHIIMFI